jgi:tol-pal system protein YbgF
VIRRAAAVVAILAFASPSWAANKDIERLQLQIVNLQSQVTDLQRLLEDNLKEIRRLNDALAQQNGSIKKAIEDQKTQSEAIQAGLRDAMDRMGEMRERAQAAPAPAPLPGNPAENAGGTGAPAAAQAGGAQPPAPRELYSQAYADYARGNYDLAIQAFQEYLKNYPQTDFSDNAQYWIGECHYGKQRYAEAVEAWNTLLRDFPSSDKLPDARVKKGMALERLGRRSQALVEYRFVVDRYPNSPAARLARERLNP